MIPKSQTVEKRKIFTLFVPLWIEVQKMKRTLISIITSLLLLLLLSSCEERNMRANMEIRIATSQAKTLLPEDTPLDVVKYRIEGTGPDGNRIAFETSRTTYLLEGMLIGRWELTAWGLNREGVKIVTGETEFNLSPSSTTATIVLDKLPGAGTLSLTFRWDKSRVTNPSLKLFLTPDGGKTSQYAPDTVDSASGTASFRRIAMPSGSYTFTAHLYSGETKSAGFTEAVRIVSDKITESTINFDLTESQNGQSGSITLVNNADVPVKCSITGLEGRIKANEETTVALTPVNADIGEVTAIWYLDGEKVGEGKTAKLKPQTGCHRLDVVASTSKLGSTGSAYLVFEAALLGQCGEPVKNELTVSSQVSKPDNGCYDFTSEGRLILSSRLKRTLQVCSVVDNALREETLYDTVSSQVSVSDITSLHFISEIDTLITTHSSPHNLSALSYSPISLTLRKRLQTARVLDKDGRFIASGYREAFYVPALEKILSISDIAGTDPEFQKGLSILDPNAGSDRDFVYDWRNYTLTEVANPTVMAQSPGGDSIMHLDPETGNLGEILYILAGTRNRIGVQCADADRSVTEGAGAMYYLDDDHLAVANGNLIHIFEKQYPYPTEDLFRFWSEIESVSMGTGRDCRALLGNRKDGFLYAINGNSIVTFRMGNETLQPLYTTPLEFSPSFARLSPDGSRLVIQEEGSGDLHFYEIML
jgi:hypothetical protein